MRGIRRTVALAATAVALAAPSAWAQEEHLFVASDGTRCVGTQTHSTTPEPGGTYSVRFGGGVRCDKPLRSMFVRSELFIPPDRWEGASFWTCGQPWNLCKADFYYDSNSLVTGLEGAEYVNWTGVSLEVAEPHVWAITPYRLDTDDPTNISCAPGQRYAGCGWHESFKPE